MSSAHSNWKNYFNLACGVGSMCCAIGAIVLRDPRHMPAQPPANEAAVIRKIDMRYEERSLRATPSMLVTSSAPILSR